MKYRVLNGDAVAMLKTLPDESVQCCVTSPPYYGLRDYGHDGQLGLEPTPEAYIAGMVAVLEEVRRVLRNDGTLWLNIGDSYASTGGHTRQGETSQRQGRTNVAERHKVKGHKPSVFEVVQDENGDCTRHIFSDGVTLCGRKATSDRWCRNWKGMAVDVDKVECEMCVKKYTSISPVKTKDLIGIPWMLAFALRGAGYYLRQDIIWHKPNPMPESVRDRCTKAHEYVFLLSKSGRYYYDADAIAEKAVGPFREREKGNGESAVDTKARGSGTACGTGRRSGGASFGKQNHDATAAGQQSRTYERPEYLTRNCRSVWAIPTKSYHGAHFAVMPASLAERCILAGSKPGDTVLDPFAGSGTTLEVALSRGRKAIGIELNPAYMPLIEKRTEPYLPKPTQPKVDAEPEPSSDRLF